MKKLTEKWSKALSCHLKNTTINSELISNYELTQDSVVVSIGTILYSCSISRLADWSGRTAEYLVLEFKNYEDYEVIEFLEHSFVIQEKTEAFFVQLRDAMVSLNKIGLVDLDIIDLVDELEASMPKLWDLEPDAPNAPFPSPEDEFPNLEDYSVSFFAVGE